MVLNIMVDCKTYEKEYKLERVPRFLRSCIAVLLVLHSEQKALHSNT